MQGRTPSACEQSFGTLTSVCNTPEGKEAVQKLTRAARKFSTTGTEVSISGTTSIVKIDPANSSISGKSPDGYSWISAIKEALNSARAIRVHAGPVETAGGRRPAKPPHTPKASSTTSRAAPTRIGAHNRAVAGLTVFAHAFAVVPVAVRQSGRGPSCTAPV